MKIKFLNPANTYVVITNYKGHFRHINNAKKWLTISKLDIARGLLSVGKTHWAQYLINPRKTLVDFIYYWASLEMVITDKPKLTLSEGFINLDMSDKVLKSYQIGMGISKIIAERILNVPYLQHVDQLVKEGIIKLNKGSNERGDMIGFDVHGNWHVIEAKGRSSRPDNKVKAKAKSQAEKIIKISRKKPTTKSYCITYINQNFSEILLNDPDEFSNDRVELEIDSGSFIKFYYDKILSSLYARNEDFKILFINQGLEFLLFQISKSQNELYIGVEKNLLLNLKSGKKEGLLEIVLSGLHSRFGVVENSSFSIGNDGILLYQIDLGRSPEYVVNV